eukprot:361363-Chlamydomonas_euryale.AAC.3
MPLLASWRHTFRKGGTFVAGGPTILLYLQEARKDGPTWGRLLLVLTALPDADMSVTELVSVGSDSTPSCA